jgi:serine/threonine protein kinase/Tfp pilus assembly protein PilF
MKYSSEHNLMIDETLDKFEQDWSVSDDRLIQKVVSAAGAVENQELILELIRADIGRRYAAGVPVSIESYSERFPEVFADGERMALVCYEDFRARRSRGLACPPDRWSGMSTVAAQAWYRELLATHPESGDWSSPAEFRQNMTSVIESPRNAVDGERADVLRMGDFELVALLGSGSFSRVYLARQLSLGCRYVALKVVNRALREPAHLARLQHTGIVPLYSYHYADGRWLLCMPYSGPATLADWLKRTSDSLARSGRSLVETVHTAQQRVTVRSSLSSTEISHATTEGDLESLRKWHEAGAEPLSQLSSLDFREFTLWIFRRLASALAHAHQRGIVHGDLKPANVLIRNDGEPALIDFNLSQAIDDGPRRWSGGTLAYMAPEQLTALANHKPGTALPQADIYALGLMMFEIIEGRLPFAGPFSSAEADLLAASRNRTGKLVFQQIQAVNEGLRRIVERCLAARPEDRYMSGTELLEDLDLEAAALPLKYAKESWLGSRLPKLFRRYPRVFSAGSVGIISFTLMAALFVAMVSYRKGAERLSAIQTLQSFGEASDQIFSRFLMAEAWGHENADEDRLQPFRQSLQNLGVINLATTSKGDSSHWRRFRTLLTPDENTWIDERLHALAFILAHDPRITEGQRKGADAAVDRDALVETILSSLNSDASGSLSAQASLAIAGSDGQRQIVPKDRLESSEITDPTLSEDAADRTLQALGRLFQSRPDLAVELLETTRPPESLSLIYWVTKARAHLELNDSRQAINSFSMALQDPETAAIVYLNRGLAQLRSGAFKEATHDFSESVQRDPSLVPAYVNRHAALLAVGNHEAALLDLDRAIQLSPDSPRLRLIRSRVLRQLGRLKAAQTDFQLAMKQRPKSSDDWVSVALARLPDDPEQSLKDLQTADTLFGVNSTVLQSMAHVLSEHLHRPEEAIVALDRLLEKSPDFQKALAGRAVLMARAGKVDEVRRDLQRLTTLPMPPTTESLYQMACACALCSEADSQLKRQALFYLAEAVERGYGGQLLLTDPDLELLRTNPEFDVIVKHFELTTAYRK